MRVSQPSHAEQMMQGVESLTMQLGFLASHNGSSMRAILEAIERQALQANGAVLISNNPQSGAIKAATDAAVPAFCFNQARCGSEDAVDEAIVSTLQRHQVDTVILSGYMKRIGPKTLDAYRQRILNIHPSLLPQFGGEGMYGIHVHTAVLAARVKETGATVHLVNEVYDEGEILGQVRVPVWAGDTPAALQARVAKEEGPLYVQVLRQWRPVQAGSTFPK